jgi:hypothetical protein
MSFNAGLARIKRTGIRAGRAHASPEDSCAPKAQLDLGADTAPLTSPGIGISCMRTPLVPMAYTLGADGRSL